VTQPAQIPTGTVTLLFTDVQGSTRLWETEPEAMAVGLRRHDSILRAAIGEQRGYVFKTVGDAFCAAFWTPQEALASVLRAQRDLVTEAWPTTRPIRVRMGLHTGVCEERDNDYFGPVVNRAARLEAVAHGGQVLISGTTAELLFDSMPESVALRDLGLHRLKDLGRPEQIYQLEADFLAASFPPISSLDNPELPNNLPALLTGFVGRERELAEVRGLIRSSRLLTLTGAGGSGKTRLALQAAAELIDSTPDGVWLAELAPITDGDQIAGIVAAALGLPARGSESLTEALTGQDVLILLDNCEHVIDAAAKFCEHVIRHCPKVRFLATSREPLGIDGERVYRVPSLSLPLQDAETASELTGCDSVLLLIERARGHDPSFSLDDSVAPLVATVCCRLDGIPLALELAAARLSSMSLRQVAQRLDQRFRLLTGGSRNAMPRQQTLQATVDWSFGLLHKAERETLARLSVFAGGFELEAAEQICATDDVDALDVLDLVRSLVDKSLVVADHAQASMRYRLLETIRQYSAQELLRSAGEEEVLRIRDRHAAHYLDLAEAAAPALRGHGQGEALRRLDLEWDNVRAAFAHLAAEQRATDILRLGVALQRFALSRGHAELLNHLLQAVDQIDQEPSSLLASALLACTWMTYFFHRAEPGQLAFADTYADRGLAMARAIGDRRLEARALSLKGGGAYFNGDRATQRQLCEDAVAIARQTGDIHLLGDLLGMLAVNDTDDATRSIRLEALDCLRRSGDELLAASELHMIYGLDLHAGQLAEGQAHLEEAVAMAERLGDQMFLFFFRSDLAILLLMRDRHADALPVVRRCLLAARRMGHRVEICELLFGAACCAAWQGDLDRAARLHGASDVAIERAIGERTISWSAAEQELRVREQSKLREQLVPQHFEAAYRAGAALSRSEALDLALSQHAQERIASNSR
jgi:predicted ATPase/class 3 adenylate cyclase